MNKRRIHKLFARLNAVYGGTWSGRYPTPKMFDLAVEEWGADLAPYSDGEIEEAFKLCKQRYTTAPSLPQFVELAKLAHLRKYKPVQPTQGEPASPEVAQYWIAEIRAKLSEMEAHVSPPASSPAADEPETAKRDRV